MAEYYLDDDWNLVKAPATSKDLCVRTRNCFRLNGRTSTLNARRKRHKALSTFLRAKLTAQQEISL